MPPKKASEAGKAPKARTKGKAKAKAAAPEAEKLLKAAADNAAKLESVLNELFKIYDQDEDGRIERVEYLDVEEKRFGGSSEFGVKERKEAFRWFKESGAEGTPADGMWLSPEAWKSAFVAKAAAESEIPVEEKGGLADWIGENYLTKLVAVFYKDDAAAAGASSSGPPEYPLTCPLKEIMERMQEARACGRMVLLLAQDVPQVETFLQYQMSITIDAKEILGETLIRKTKSKEDVLSELRTKLKSAMNSHGFTMPIHIRMANTAFDWKSFCTEDFPAEVFSATLWTIEHAHSLGWFDDGQKLNLEIEDEKKWKEFYVVVSSTFDLDMANEHLFDKIPHYDELAIIIVDPKSVA